MPFRNLLLLLMMLPALLLPQGLTIGLCSCTDMHTPRDEHSCCKRVVPARPACCAAATSSAISTEQDGPAFVGACGGCHRLALLDEPVQRTETARPEWFASAVPFVTLARVCAVTPTRIERTPRWMGARSPAPPDRAFRLPLLI